MKTLLYIYRIYDIMCLGVIMMASVQVYKSGKYEYVRIVESYRDPKTRKPKVRILKNLGNKEALEQQEPGIVERLKRELQESRIVSQNVETEKNFTNIKRILEDESLNTQGAALKNYGYKVYEQVWKDLNLDYFFNYRQKTDTKIEYSTREIAKMLTFMRLMYPSSKKKALERYEELWNTTRPELTNVYRCLDFIATQKTNLEKHLNKQLGKLYHRNLSVCFYDVTTYYFESVEPDELKRFGYSKDNKVNQVQVVMGLLIDDHGIPISYELFPGNTNDFKTLEPIMQKLKEEYGITKITITADRGLNSKSNLQKIRELGYDYVMAYKIRTASNAIQSKVIDPAGYQTIGEGFRYKEEELVTHVKTDGITHTFTDKFILTYSEKRAKKDRQDRERLIDKAKKLSESKTLMKSELQKGGKKYIQFSFLETDITYNESKAEEDERYDGYYGIVSSNKELTPQEIINIYQGLWKIEESFRVLKSNLEARPIYVSTESSIKGHFVICYLALVIQRYLEYLLKQQGISYSTELIQESIRSAMVSLIEGEEETKYYIKNEPKDTFQDILRALNKKDIPTFGKSTLIKL